MFDRYIVPLGSHLMILGFFLLSILYAHVAHAELAVTQEEILGARVLAGCEVLAPADTACTKAKVKLTLLEFLNRMHGGDVELVEWGVWYEIQPGRTYMVRALFMDVPTNEAVGYDIFVKIDRGNA